MMQAKHLWIWIGLFAWPILTAAQTTLPAAGDRPGLPTPHFPSPLHTFVWRNWECFPPERLARVVGGTPQQIVDIAHSMGLPDWTPMSADQFRRNYICVIRRNWHLLNYDQLLTLLDWTPDRLAYTLREDDFLWIKLGFFKPACPPIRYEPPNADMQKRCEEIRQLVRPQIEAMPTPVPRCDFMKEFESKIGLADTSQLPDSQTGSKPLRFIYSYCSVYGDPLLSPDLDPYPDGLLSRLSQVGVNGIWMHVVLRDLASSPLFPEFGKDSDVRLQNLSKLVERARRFGVRIYLYMNEPRAMPAAFFEKRPELRGVKEGDFVTMCTSQPIVRQWISDSLAHVFQTVPHLGGVFTITASENLTHCCSHFQQAGCPRCSKRPLPEVIAEVNQAISEGVHRSSPSARVIAWDWSWPNDASPDIIRNLPADVSLMSVSEWDQPFTRGDVPGTVSEYSISVVGPGPRAKRHWELARARGLDTVAKVQMNCTWELSAVPYLPAMNLIAEHCVNLRAAHVGGLMLSWTLGGYPSPNLELVQRILDAPQPPTAAQALSDLAHARYGESAAPHALVAWSAFSRAFAEYPYDGSLLYNGPQQLGPANLLYLKPSGFTSTMVGFPYDYLEAWRGHYPASVLSAQFEKVSRGWPDGIAAMERALNATNDPGARSRAESDLRMARAAGLHLSSTANQVDFIIARQTLLGSTATTSDKAKARKRMLDLIEKEIQAAKELLTLTAQDSRIGYEASNHYYYLPTDLLEKIVSCEWENRELQTANTLPK